MLSTDLTTNTAMKKIFWVLTMALALVSAPAEAKKKDKTTPEEKGLQCINRNTAQAYVEFLASDALMGREAAINIIKEAMLEELWFHT